VSFSREIGMVEISSWELGAFAPARDRMVYCSWLISLLVRIYVIKKGEKDAIVTYLIT